MADPGHGRLAGRNWVLIAAAAPVLVMLLVRLVFNPAEWATVIVASAALAFAVMSLLNTSRRKTG